MRGPMAELIRSRRHVKHFLGICGLLSLCLTGSAFGQEGVFHANTSSDGVQKIEILGGDYFFDPDHIIVKANVPVEITIKKDSIIVPHNITIEAPEAGIEVSESLSRTPEVIRFTPTKPGKYAFYCTKKLFFSKSHREKGMEGVLEVRP